MEHIFDTVIIGGGPAGYSAALYSARAGLSTAVIEKMSAGGQMALTDIIENYPGFCDGIDGFSLGMQMQQGAEKFGAETHYGEVLSVALEKEVKEIVTDSEKLLAKTVIIATGADPRPLGLENEAALVGRGLHYCAHCDGRFYKDKVVAVVGGGNSAASDALYLSNLAKKVYLIHRRDTLRATKIYHEPLLSAENVEFLWNSKVAEPVIDGKIVGAEIENIALGTSFKLSFDGLFVSVGRVPSTAVFKGQVEMEENGYIIADETTKTNIPGVFAAGDVRVKALRQVITAASDGAVAAHFAEEYLMQKR